MTDGELQTYSNPSGFTRTYYRRNNKIYIHNIGGPAEVNANNGICWYVDNNYCITVKKYCKLCKFDDMTTLIWVLKYGKFLPRILDEI